MHLTLVFLGSQDPELQPAIERAIASSAGESAPFRLRLGEPGSFGGRRSLRVVWVGVEDHPTGSLSRLNRALSSQLKAANISFDTAPFRAHVTVGRARRDATSTRAGAMYAAIARRAASAKDLPVEAIECQEITLMRSDLRPTGPIYTPLYRARLGAEDERRAT
jgi:2'-5' RNA ligase